MNEETKKKISQSRKGILIGHKYWGPSDVVAHAKEMSRRSIASRRISIEKNTIMVRCKFDECEKYVPSGTNKRSTKYCSRECSKKFMSKYGNFRTLNKGKTPSHKSGRTKWYEYNSPLNGVVKLQGSWEVRLAFCLDIMGMDWRTNHNKDRFLYTDLSGIEKSYAPDFYNKETGEYIEVKGYIDEGCRHKLDRVIESGAKIKIVDFRELKKIETSIFGKPLCAENLSKSAARVLGINQPDVNPVSADTRW